MLFALRAVEAIMDEDGKGVALPKRGLQRQLDARSRWLQIHPKIHGGLYECKISRKGVYKVTKSR